MATSFTRTYRTFATATLDKLLSKRFEDVISRASPFLRWLMNDDGVTGRGPTPGRKNGGTSRYVAGTTGDYFRVDLMTELSDTTKWYDGTESFDVVEEEVGTAAFFQPKQLGATVTISGKDKRRNAGKEQHINMLQARAEQVLITLKNDLAVACITANTSSKAILGIPDMIPTDRGTSTAYGKITGSTSSKPWWLVNRSRTAGGTYGDVGDFATNFRKYGKRLFNDCTEGGDRPDIHLVSQELYESYDDLMIGYQRVINKPMEELGMPPTLSFMGAPVVWDRKHPTAQESSQTWYMVNSNYVMLMYDPAANFTTLGFQRPSNADYITSPVIWQGALITNNRRVHGVLTGITGIG